MYCLAVEFNIFTSLIMQHIISSLIKGKFGNLCVTLGLLSLGSKHCHLLVEERNDVVSPSRSLNLAGILFPVQKMI